MLDAVNNSKMFLGIMLIVINIGSRHLIDEISTSDDEYRRNIVLRRIAIFAVCFVGTRDLVTSLMLTAGFIIIASGISRRSREGMDNPVSEADQPAYDESVPPMFLEKA
jgi:hypothetical protein